jgi:hypothetical protein
MLLKVYLKVSLLGENLLTDLTFEGLHTQVLAEVDY